MCCFFLQTLPHVERAAVQPTFAWFIQESEEKVCGFVRERNKVEDMAKTVGEKEPMGDLYLPLLVLKLQEIRHHYEGAG